MQKALATRRAEGLEGLRRAAGAPHGLPLYGTKAKPAIFIGTAATTRQAAEQCVSEGWLEGTGGYVGTGKSRKEWFSGVPTRVTIDSTTVGDYLQRAEAAGLGGPLPGGLDGASLEQRLFHQTRAMLYDRTRDFAATVRHNSLSNQGETDMADKGKKDKGKREQQKTAQLNPKEKRKLKREKKKSMLGAVR